MKTEVELTFFGQPIILIYDGDYLEKIGSVKRLTANEHEKLCKWLSEEGFLNSLNNVYE